MPPRAPLFELRCRVRFAGLIALLLAADPLVGAVRVGQGELAFSTTLAGVYDSNPEGRTASSSTTYLTLTPRLSYSRDRALIESKASLGMTFERYLTGPIEDRENLSASGSLKIPTGRFGRYSADLSASYVEASTADGDINQSVVRETTSLTAALAWALPRGFGLTANAGYSAMGSEGFAANDSLTLGAGASAPIGRDTNVGLTYSYRRTEADAVGTLIRGLDQTSDTASAFLSRKIGAGVTGRVSGGYYWLKRGAGETRDGRRSTRQATYSASLDGPFLPPRRFPKLQSRASLSYGTAESPGLDDDGGAQVTGALSLGWEPRHKTSVSTSLSRSRSLSVTNLSAESTQASVSLSQGFVSGWSANTGASYQWRTLRGVERRSEVLSLNFGGGRKYGAEERLVLEVAYAYVQSWSDFALSDYDGHTARLSLGYTF